MTLALLLTAVTGAWAEEATITLNCGTTEKTFEKAELPWSSTADILKEVISDFKAGPSIVSITGGDGKVVKNGNENFQVTGTFSGKATVDVAYLSTSYSTSMATITVTAPGPAAPPVTVAWNASTKTGTFTMPGSDVVLTPIYAKAAAFATTGTESEVKTLLPAAAEGVIAGTDASLIAEGTGIVAFAGTSTDVTQGTLKYAIGTSATEAPALTAFSATVPTAKDIADDGATVYVWYYIQGADAPDGVAATLDNTFDNTEPACLTVQVLTNKFDIQFNPANANTIEAGKATVTVGGTAATVTEGKLQGVKMGSEVKVKANTGYKLRKVEVKKKAAAPTTITVTWNGADITGTGGGKSFTKDGVTITAGDIEFMDKNFLNGGTFTTTLGNFTKIEVTTDGWYASGTGWSGSTWTGNASSVSFSGEIMGYGGDNLKFVFTIEPTN